MIVDCVANSGADLGPYRRGLFYTEETRFDLTVGKSYEVYAMALISGSLTVLVADEYDKPAWLPIELFEVRDPRVPDHWEFAKGEVGPNAPAPGELICQARWGYGEVVRSEIHYYGLEERDPEALRIFHEERSRGSRD
ncbi:hypothetical protein [Kitasatospora sp. NPDC047058]|uniref:hypothetical protein n=1 Tax=Kitasatospora sp. NPDC047058 TaxID=3155620 RepID=UPI0033EFE81F